MHSFPLRESACEPETSASSWASIRLGQTTPSNHHRDRVDQHAQRRGGARRPRRGPGARARRRPVLVPARGPDFVDTRRVPGRSAGRPARRLVHRPAAARLESGQLHGGSSDVGERRRIRSVAVGAENSSVGGAAITVVESSLSRTILGTANVGAGCPTVGAAAVGGSAEGAAGDGAFGAEATRASRRRTR